MSDAASQFAAFKRYIAQGDASRASGDWAGATQSYKAAGQYGADTLGPAIDAMSGGSTSTTALTSQAWSMNGLLAELNSLENVTQDDANQAWKFIQQMLAWYTAAYGYAKAIVATPAATPSIATTERNIILPTAKTLPQQMQPKPGLMAQMHLTHGEAVGAAGGGFLGLAVGARFFGFAIGGPVGGLLGAFLGYELSKQLKL